MMNNDPLLFPFLKNNPNAEEDLNELHNTLIGSTIGSVGRHGKYFWMRLNLNKDIDNMETGVLLMHFGMTGMIKIKDVKSHLIFMENGGDKKILKQMEEQKSTGTLSKFFKKELKEEVNTLNEDNDIVDEPTKRESNEVKEDIDQVEYEWPPKFVKFEMELEKDGKILHLAFVDPRRLGRVRYLSGPTVQTEDNLMKVNPLSELGPDYSKPLEASKVEFTTGDPDPDNHGRPRLSLEQFNNLIMSKKKPIKSLLLEQEHFAGVGNWVGDEILYHARIHPNDVLSSKIQKTDTVDPIIVNLYNSLIYVCEYSVRVEGDVTKFPSNWLMLYRWGKRRKNSPKPKTEEGYEVDYVTIGGRTSCFVPQLQKILGKKHTSEKLEITEDKQLGTKKRRRA